MNDQLKNKMPWGLSTSEVIRRRLEFGKNEIVPTDLGMGIANLLKFFKDPMGLMMLGLALIYFLLGENRDAYFMLIAFIPVSAIDVYLELKAEKALGALRATFQSTAKVFRDGVITEVLIEEIVPGDFVALEEGQTIPADGLVKVNSGLNINEAALTGESIPVEKKENDELYAGTSIILGNGAYQVTATGRKTKFGKIVKLLETTDESLSPLQKKVNKFVGQILKIAAVLVLCLFILELVRGKSFLESLLISLTFGMASVPEEFPLVFTLYLSLGAWRLAKSGVLVKSLPSVETLGSVNVICTDKTGTLTEGHFQLNEIIPFFKIDEDQFWKFAILACEPIVVDSMEKAIVEKSNMNFDYSEWTLISDYPFEVVGKHMSHAWKNKNGETVVAMKGAIEGVLNHCIESIEVKKEILKKSEQLSSKGCRLLGLAGKKDLITGKRVDDESGLSFLGILSFSDPIRENAKAAIDICQKEGIKVKMITGDHPFTAHAIAEELHLEHSHDALYTGEELNKLTSEEKITAFREGAIFSRVTPEQKYELVKFLKDDGMIVAMTGDGINDTPAMKIADIGISMGEKATDTARSTAKMVLTNSDFYGIVHAIMEGRRIFSNLRKSFSYLVAFHVPVVLLSFFPPLFKLGDVFRPIHIIILELVVHPVSAFAFLNLENSPGKMNKSIIDKKTALTAILSGILLSIFSLSIFVFMKDISFDQKRTFVLSTILFGNIGFILLETWPLFTKRLVLIISLLIFFTLAFIMIPELSVLLHLSQIPDRLIAISFILGLVASVPSLLIRARKID